MTYSIRKNIYWLFALLITIVILWFVNYSGNKALGDSEHSYARFVELDSQFLRMVVTERVRIGNEESFSELFQELEQLAGQCQSCHSYEGTLWKDRRRFLLEQHDEILITMELRHQTRVLIGELLESVRYIHSHHVTALENFLTHQQEREQVRLYITTREKDDAVSASEPDIIKQTVTIQQRLADIANDFYRLASSEDPLMVHEEFEIHIADLYKAVKTFEAYSLDAQDGLLVEELLENGRILESSFHELVTLAAGMNQLTRQLDDNQDSFAQVFDIVEEAGRQERERLRGRNNVVSLVTPLLMVLLVLFFLLRARNLIRSIETLVIETDRITQDVSYRIPRTSSTLSEFHVLRDAMNAMAGKLNSQIQELHGEITTRHKVEALLSQGKKEWELTFDAVPDMIITMNLECAVLRANRAMLSFLGCSIEAVVGMRADELIEYECSRFPLPLNSISNNMAGEKDVGSDLEAERYCEFYDKKHNCYLSVTHSPLRDYDNELTGYVQVIRDITQQRKELEQRESMQERLQKAETMESMGLMAGGVAHDLNNILSGVINYPELMLMEMDEDNKWRSYLEMIQNSGKRAAAVVADLLTIARGAACVKVPEIMNELITGYLTTGEFKALAERYPEVKVDLLLTDDLYPCRCSAVHIQKVLMNLVVNGFESIKGTGTITLGSENRTLGSSDKDDLVPGDYVHITVADTGSGISQEDLQHVFEPFYSKKTMGYSGTGLGLAVVWNVVQEHNGRISVDSSPDGTNFSILLPACAKDFVPSRAADAVIPQSLPGIDTVLVVDDDEMQRDITGRMVMALGCAPVTASSGEEAVEYLREHRVDLVLLDMIMEPGMNGRQTLEEILSFKPKQKTLIVSGFADNKEVKKACVLGKTELVKKPFTLADLASAMKRVVGQES